MCGNDLADAPDEVTIRRELATWKQRLELGHQQVQPTHEFGDLIRRSEDGRNYEA